MVVATVIHRTHRTFTAQTASSMCGTDSVCAVALWAAGTGEWPCCI
jgi:hypothetical protein